MNIVVLAGGTSSERAVSIVSGTGVCKALRAKGHRAVLLDVFCGDENADSSNYFPEEYDVEKARQHMCSFNDSMNQLIKTRRSFFGPHVLEMCQEAHIVFLALHGANGEDGRLQATFDLMGIRYTGTGYLSSALAMDKTLTKHILQAHGVPMAKGYSINKNEANDDASQRGLTYPVIVKPACGGSSVGITIAHDAQEYRQSLDTAFELDDKAVVEEFVEGREFSVAVIDGKAYPVIEIAPKVGFYDYKNKYEPGATIETCPAEITNEQATRMQRHAVEAMTALGIEAYGRVDFIMTGTGHMIVLEANTLPGMTATSLVPQEAAVLGYSYNDLCQHLIDLSMKKYDNK